MNLLRLWASFFLGVFLFFVCLDSTKGQTADDQEAKEEILILEHHLRNLPMLKVCSVSRSVPTARYWLLR